MKRPATLLRSLTVGLVLVGMLAGLVSWQVPAPRAGAASDHVGALQSTAAAGAMQATAPPETTAAPQPTAPPATVPPQPTAPPTPTAPPVTAAAIQQVATVPAATQAAATPTAAALPGGLIAATGNDGNIWVMNPDGSGQVQITTTGSASDPFLRPRWSPDGTMLVFGGNENSGGSVYLYRDGAVSQVPNVHGCTSPMFLSNTQLAFGCGDVAAAGTPTESDLTSKPELGFVSTSNLDGSDWRVLIPYSLTGDPAWGSQPRQIADNIEVSPSDGTLLVTQLFKSNRFVHTAAADGSGYAPADVGLASFAPDGGSLIRPHCEGTTDQCFHNKGPLTYTFQRVDLNGNVQQQLLTLPENVVAGRPSSSPDGSAIVFMNSFAPASQQGTISVATVPNGQQVAIGATTFLESDPVWQPVAAQLPPPTGQPVATAAPPAQTAPAAMAPPPAVTTPPSAATHAATRAATVPTVGGGLIAYEGADRNIWVVRPDGSGARQITTDGTKEHPYRMPRWSQDGTMLVFTGPVPNGGSNPGVYLYRDGTVSRIPGKDGCDNPAFFPNGQRLAYTCGYVNNGNPYPSPDQLQSDPSLGRVSSSDLSGGDWRVEVTFNNEPTNRGTAFFGAYFVDVSADGRGFLMDAGNTLIPAHVDMGGGSPPSFAEIKSDSWFAAFTPDRQHLVAALCSGGCFKSQNSYTYEIVRLSGDGSSQHLLTMPPNVRPSIPSLSASGQTVTFSTGYVDGTGTPTIYVAVVPDGQPAVIGQGQDPVWQPTAANLKPANGSASAGPPAATQSPANPPAPNPAAPAAAAPPTGGALKGPLIAFTKGGNVWLMNQDGSGQRAVTSGGAADQPTRWPWYQWSPDGKELLIAKDGDLLVLDAATLKLRTLKSGVPTGFFRPSWATDVDAIAYVDQVDTNGKQNPTPGDPVSYSVARIDLSGKTAHLATFDRQQCLRPEDVPMEPAQSLLIGEIGWGTYPVASATTPWNAGARIALFTDSCGATQVANLATGAVQDIAIGEAVLGANGRLVGYLKTPDSIYSFAKELVVGSPAPSAQTATIGAGQFPAWSPDAAAVYFSQCTHSQPPHTLNMGDAVPIDIAPDCVLLSAKADGSHSAKLTEQAVFGFGPPSPTSDNKALIVAAVDSSLDLWNHRLPGDKATTQIVNQYGPHVRILSLDLKTNQVKTLVVDGGRPAAQPAGKVGLAPPATNPTPAPRPTQPTASKPPSGTGKGPLVAFTKNNNVWLMNADGSGQRAVTTDGAALGGSQTGARTMYLWYQWSPDGKYLLIVKDVGQGVTSPSGRSFLLLDPATGKLRTLASGLEGVPFWPGWANDADAIAFIAHVGQGQTADGRSGAAYDLKRIDLAGTISDLATVTVRNDCGGPSGGQFDPAFDLAINEYGLFPNRLIASVQWSASARQAIVLGWCGGWQFVDLATGNSQPDSAGGVLGVNGKVAGPASITASPSGHAAVTVAGLQPGAPAVTVGDGTFPSWSADGQSVYFVRCDKQSDQRMTLYPGEQGLEQRDLSPQTCTLTQARADGSQSTKLLERDVYAFGPASPLPDGSAVVFSAINNSTDLWNHRLPGDTYTAALLAQYGPHVRILRLDIKSGKVTTLLVDAGRPVVQPAAKLTTRQAAAAPSKATNAPVAVATGGFPPRSGQLAYGLKLNGHWDVYVYDFAAGKSTQLTNLPGSDQWAPAYSHDGTRLAYLSDQADGTNQVWIMNPDGSNQHQITAYQGGADDQIAYVAWTADDQALILTVGTSQSYRLMTVPASGGSQLQDFMPAPASFYTAGSGGQICYVSDDQNGIQYLTITHAGGGDASVVQEAGVRVDAPNFSADGAQVAYQVGGKGARRVRVHGARTGQERDIPVTGADDSNPVWLGANIAYVSGGQTDAIMVVPGGGGAAVALNMPPHDGIWYLAARPHA